MCEWTVHTGRDWSPKNVYKWLVHQAGSLSIYKWSISIDQSWIRPITTGSNPIVVLPLEYEWDVRAQDVCRCSYEMLNRYPIDFTALPIATLVGSQNFEFAAGADQQWRNSTLLNGSWIFNTISVLLSLLSHVDHELISFRFTPLITVLRVWGELKVANSWGNSAWLQTAWETSPSSCDSYQSILEFKGELGVLYRFIIPHYISIPLYRLIRVSLSSTLCVAVCWANVWFIDSEWEFREWGNLCVSPSTRNV